MLLRRMHVSPMKAWPIVIMRSGAMFVAGAACLLFLLVLCVCVCVCAQPDRHGAAVRNKTQEAWNGQDSTVKPELAIVNAIAAHLVTHVLNTHSLTDGSILKTGTNVYSNDERSHTGNSRPCHAWQKMALTLIAVPKCAAV